MYVHTCIDSYISFIVMCMYTCSAEQKLHLYTYMHICVCCGIYWSTLFQEQRVVDSI